ncbi:chromatin modification-related protein EAF1 [Yarrowia lipolytica]|nr:chromatin modification-related protein EAF1 [Yarrowia lipolytica]KAE8172167.1 chromatin modification-related protein EAF1 [Yarrowia lipolytica]KAJ8053858.1 chromatin modification-related protein EAF1 [Yarrowia lipolytica]QNP98151.1 Chromatin modification-related protein EAF1 [Yarrowia lipolytica]RMI99134.1 hypothetical protein BD777DRAFT_28278 [Yarrowia lipolytica]
MMDPRQETCGDIVSTRKRRLEELYYVSLHPRYPQGLDAKQKLKQFQDQFDLTQNRLFDENKLPKAVEEPKPVPTLQTSTPDAGSSPELKRRRTSSIAQLSPTFSRTSLKTNEQQLQEMLLFLVPSNIPEPTTETKSLAELYYTTQTLPLSKLIPSAHKTLTTDSYHLALLEGKLAVAHARIEELKRAGKWGPRQPKRFQDPIRRKTHWDHVLDEMEWMSTDFREERKFKQAMACEIAFSVLEYHKYGKEACCVKTKPIKFLPEEINESEDTESKMDIDTSMPPPSINPVEVTNISAADSVTVVDYDTLLSQPRTLSSTEESEDKPEEPSTDSEEVVGGEVPKRPAAPKLPESSPFKLYASVDKLDPLSKALFDNLPVTTPPGSAVNALQVPYSDPLDNSKLAPVTHLLAAPPEQDDWWSVCLEDSPADEDTLPLRSNTRSTLFNSETMRRHVVIKAPQPPQTKYLDFRTPTMWLLADDSQLLRLVKEYSYNWDIVSAHMLPQKTYGFTANIERRTSWQCFERWFQLNPTFSLTDLRGPYAQAAQQWMAAAAKAQAQSKRRISPLGVSNESIQRGHRKLRWASMFDGIRKSMRKRETTPRPNPQPPRKSQLSESNKKDIASPLDLCKMKFEQDKNLAKAYAQQRMMPGQMPGQMPPVPSNIPANRQFPGQRPPPPQTAAQIQAHTQAQARAAAAASGHMQQRMAGVGMNRMPGQMNDQHQMMQFDRQRQLMEQQKMLQQQQQQQFMRTQGQVPPQPGQVQGQVNQNVQGAQVAAGQAGMAQRPAGQIPQGQMPAQQGQVPPGQAGNQAQMMRPNMRMRPGGPQAAAPNEHLNALIRQLQNQNPALSLEAATKLAHVQVQRFVQKQQRVARQAQGQTPPQGQMRPGQPQGQPSPQMRSGSSTPMNMQSPQLMNVQLQQQQQQRSASPGQSPAQQHAMLMRMNQQQQQQQQQQNQGQTQGQNQGQGPSE